MPRTTIGLFPVFLESNIFIQVIVEKYCLPKI